MFDEAGASFGAREFATIQNRLLSHVSQTFRFMNYAVIFTVPNVTFVDVAVRRLIHAQIETKSINYKNKTSKVVWLEILANPGEEKAGKAYPRIDTADGRSGPITRMNIGKPSQRLTEPYEAARKKYIERMNHNMHLKMQAAEYAEYGDPESEPKPPMTATDFCHTFPLPRSDQDAA
jgi:hypothetical protein